MTAWANTDKLEIHSGAQTSIKFYVEKIPILTGSAKVSLKLLLKAQAHQQITSKNINKCYKATYTNVWLSWSPGSKGLYSQEVY